LVFVGENQDVNYGAQLAKGIVASGLSQRITITGWVDESTFLDYLGAADLAVQLRTLSLGETSGAVLDCMNHAVPTIVNANGAMAELPVDAVWMLTSAFEDGELRDALETLWSDKGRRQAMGLRARQVVQERHAPSCCARQYRDAIEQYYGPVHGLEVIRGLVAFDGYDVTDADCMAVAQVLTQTLPVARPARPLYVDVSAIWRDDLKTGIQRGVRALLWSLVQEPPAGYRIEPVYLSDGGGRWHYRYARDWAARIFGVPGGWMEDDAVDFAAGDILLVADLTGAFVVEGDRAGVYGALRNEGVALHFVVYDLLPVLMPEVFPPGEFGFAEWLRVVCRLADGLVCISRSVAGELREWLEGAGVDRLYPARIGWFHLGADMANALPSFGLTPEDAQKVETLKAAPYFIMVGTIEPRKGHLQVLDAFSAMWQAGSDVCLVIVGRAGWPGLPDEMRRTIPEIAKAISSHAELNQHLFWFDGVSDECLERLYAGAKCLIAASKGEGFGLPLIEAAQHGVPVLARDIPVFREVAGDHAFYFKGDEPQELREAIQTWLILEQQGKVPQSSGMPWLTWRESTAQLMANILPVKVP
jgi:glycosyltransferase involved in cell wall biosynthesis